MENPANILFIPIFAMAIAIILKWLRDFTQLVQAEYKRRYLMECREMLNRIYYCAEMRDRYRE